MLRNLYRALWVLFLIGPLALAGCGAGGGGGGGGTEKTGPPSVTGNHYVLTVSNSTVDLVDITLGATEWVSVNRTTQVWMHGPVTVLSSGIVKMVRTEISDSSVPGPDVLYGFEVPTSYLFMVESSHMAADGGFADMLPAINQEGTCASIGTQGAYNLVKTGQTEFDQLTGRAYGTATFASATDGLDLTGETRKLGEFLDTGTPVSLGTIPTLSCANGMGGSDTDSFLFTASGAGLYTRVEGTDRLDFVALPEPASAVSGAALVFTDKHYVGMYQQMVDLGESLGMEEQTFYVTANGTALDLMVDSFTDIEAGTLSGQPGTYTFGTNALRNGLFDRASMTFNLKTTPAVAAVHPVSGKNTVAFFGRYDSNANSIDEPSDWFFMILLER